ncbi:MAG: hypothetical protein Kow00127_15360 [Bacteroidales bacterium]
MEQESKQSFLQEGKPFFYKIILVSVSVYTIIMLLLLFTGLLYSRSLFSLLGESGFPWTGSVVEIRLFLMVILGIHGLLLAGTIGLWKHRKYGFYLAITALILLIVLPWFSGKLSPVSLAVYGLLLIVLTLFFKQNR